MVYVVPGSLHNYYSPAMFCIMVDQCWLLQHVPDYKHRTRERTVSFIQWGSKLNHGWFLTLCGFQSNGPNMTNVRLHLIYTLIPLVETCLHLDTELYSVCVVHRWKCFSFKISEKANLKTSIPREVLKTSLNSCENGMKMNAWVYTL